MILDIDVTKTRLLVLTYKSNPKNSTGARAIKRSRFPGTLPKILKIWGT